MPNTKDPVSNPRVLDTIQFFDILIHTIDCNQDKGAFALIIFIKVHYWYLLRKINLRIKSWEQCIVIYHWYPFTTRQIHYTEPNFIGFLCGKTNKLLTDKNNSTRQTHNEHFDKYSCPVSIIPQHYYFTRKTFSSKYKVYIISKCLHFNYNTFILFPLTTFVCYT